jgi:hypothetical protein
MGRTRAAKGKHGGGDENAKPQQNPVDILYARLSLVAWIMRYFCSCPRTTWLT